jgi:hypothetical protein
VTLVDPNMGVPGTFTVLATLLDPWNDVFLDCADNNGAVTLNHTKITALPLIGYSRGLYSP